MRLCIVLLIICINFYVNADLDPTIEKICLKKFGLKEMEFHKEINSDKPSDKVKCALVCFGQLQGMVHQNGTLDISGTMKELSRGLCDKTAAEKIISKCNKAHEEENGCVKGYGIIKCIQREVKKYQMERIE